VPELRSSCHRLLHARGLQHYQAGSTAAAAGMLRPALFFAGDLASSCKTAMLLSACCMK